jgi:uncharacterized protein with HEPN domain
MSRHRLRVADYLEHILEATRRIEDYSHGMNQDDFLSNRLVQDAVIRNFEIIGEASRNVLSETDNPRELAMELVGD